MSRMELRFGAPVTDSELEYGSLSAVTVEDGLLHWQTLVVRRGPLGGEEGFVPREAVREAEDGRIVIAQPPVAGAPPGAQAMSSHTEVHGADDVELGRLAVLLAGEDGRLQQIVIQRHPFGERNIVPITSVVAIEPAVIATELTPEMVDALPVYRTDGELADHALDAVEGVGPLAEDDLRFLRVEALDGVVVLTGHIRSRSWSDAAQAAVAAIPGVLGVDNQLVCDDELGQEVADALTSLPHAYEYAFAAQVQYGVVELSGRAEDLATAEAASEMTAGIPTVRGVVNHIDAPGFVKDEDWIEPPAIGEPVYGDNGILGHVERVVIDPRRRSFVGLVVELRVPRGASREGELLRGRSFIRRQETRVINEAAVYLHQGVPMGLEERPVRDLVAPAPPDWRPPFPYQPSEVACPAPLAQLLRPA